MKNLILGSQGQIGLSLKEYLLSEGEEVYEMDIVNSEDQDLRVANNELLDTYMRKADFVYFLAFDVGGSRYLEIFQDTPQFILNNLQIMNEVFKCIHKYNKKFIFASSQMSNMSYSNYGILKLLGEKTTISLNGLITQFWNVYGIEKDEEKSHVITDFVKMAMEGEIKMRTDGSEERQFLNVKDCSKCLKLIRENYSTFNPSVPLQVTNFEWTAILDIAKIVQKKIPCKISPNTKIDSVQKNLKNEPSTEILAIWKPEILLEDGIQEVINYEKANR